MIESGQEVELEFEFNTKHFTLVNNYGNSYVTPGNWKITVDDLIFDLIIL